MFLDNVLDAAGDFVLAIVSGLLSPILFILDVLNIIDFEVSYGGSS